MTPHYTNERNIQMLIYLLKENGIKKVIVNPGTMNMSFVASIQSDDYFELYSCVDERSACYMACGLSVESGEPVVLTCTGATASRNYMPGLTEAYYRKLPVLAITSSRSVGQIGQNIDQVTDRLHIPTDIARKSVYVPVPRLSEEMWECNLKINMALIELRRHGGGPTHINLMTTYDEDFSVKELPETRVINYYSYGYDMPELCGKIGVFVGAHLKWSEEFTAIVDEFCEKYNAVVLFNRTSNYKGKYGVNFFLLLQQKQGNVAEKFDKIIYLGDVTSFGYGKAKEVWRVNRDGEVRDTFKNLTKVFEMEEIDFFKYYVTNTKNVEKNTSLYEKWEGTYQDVLMKAKEKGSEMPFSNAWIALQMHDKMPLDSVIHFGILNSVRCWDYFDVDKSIDTYCNTGGYGIDGCVSSLIGASLMHPEKLYFGIVGDLAFFYDMNSLGNRHVGKNIRLLIVNNAVGSEFKNHMNLAQRAGVGEAANDYIAAAGHYGNKSKELVRHYAQDLGFKYLTAENKEEFYECAKVFLDEDDRNQSIVFEVFTSDKDETEALKIMQTLETTLEGKIKNKAKQVLGRDKTRQIEAFLKR